MGEPVITADKLSVSCSVLNAFAVEEMEFSVEKGEVFDFLGPSKAGKSTTQRVLTQLLRRYEGKMDILGRPLHERGRTASSVWAWGSSSRPVSEG